MEGQMLAWAVPHSYKPHKRGPEISLVVLGSGGEVGFREWSCWRRSVGAREVQYVRLSAHQGGTLCYVAKMLENVETLLLYFLFVECS